MAVALRKDPLPAIRDRVDSLLKDEAVLTTGIVKLEILAGARTEKEYARLKARFDALDHVDTGDEVWQDACDYGFRLRRKGLTIPSTDILIAACTIRAGAVLVHADVHFDSMAKTVGLRVESHVQMVKRALS